MKNLFFALALILSAATIQAQTFELEKVEPKVMLKFMEIVPDTLTGSILYDGKLIEGKVVRHRYKCTFDYNEKHEGEIFYTLPTEFFDNENKALDAKKVLGWNLPHNGFATLGSRWNGYGFTLGSINSTVYCGANSGFGLASDSMPETISDDQDEFLPNSVEIEISN